MGFLAKAEHVAAYRQIRRSAAATGAPVLIMAAPTVDAVCALRVLAELLRSDMLPYRVLPVAGYDDVAAANEHFAHGCCALVMLGCGGAVDVAELLSVAPEVTVYIADSHRPYALANLAGNAQVRVLDDGFVAARQETVERAYSYTQLADSDASDVSGDEYSDDADTAMDADFDGSPGDFPDGASGRSMRDRLGDAAPRARPRHVPQAEREECRARYREYHAGSAWQGASVARIMYDIAADLGRDSNDHLWCAIMGTTFQHTMELITPAAYAAAASELRERVLQLNRDDSDAGGAPKQAAVLDVPVADAAGGLAGMCGADAAGRIACAPDFRFMLARHWTLFDGMLHSRYMATRLGAWRDKGRRLLETLLVKMGIPLAQCRLDYSSMAAEYKESLPGRIARHAAEFGLADVSFPSFMRTFGYVLRLSASDAVYALMAILESPAAAAATRLDALADNFYRALDALSAGPGAVESLRSGVALAMRQQQAVLHEATLVLAHRQLRYGRRFRHAVLRHPAAAGGTSSWLATHPLALSKLALFLRDATASSPHGRTPLLLAARQPSHTAAGAYLVVAADGCATHAGERGRSAFGLAFRRAAQDVRARVRHDGFDTSVIEVREEDLKVFLHELQRVL